MSKVFCHPFYLYLSISEFKLLRQKLEQESFFTYSHTYHKYTSTYTYFENIYTISKEPLGQNTSSSTMISKDVIRKGKERGLMLVYIHWNEKESNKDSLTNFLNLFKYKLVILGYTPDWLGHPIYTIVNKENILKRREQLSYEK